MARAFQQGDEPVRGYRLVNYLGKGSFGDVWQASGPGGTEVAFKMIPLEDKPDHKNLRLIELVKKIRHPNLCPILAMWIKSEEGVFPSQDEQGLISGRAHTLDSFSLDEKQPRAEALYLAMGLGEKSLLERFKECKDSGEVGIPAMELISYFEDAARAMDFLNSAKHELGKGLAPLPHCDVKPQNLMIVGGALQVSDFGLMHVLYGHHLPTPSSLSAAFHSPEILDGGIATAYSDQYSLAICYHFLRTGALPFSMNEANVVLTEALEGRLDLSRLSTAEQQVVRRATSRRPEARYENCQDLVRELRRAVERSGTVHVDGLVIEPNREIVPGHKLVSLIGRGAYGEVWQALAPGRLPIALKIIKDLDRASGRGRQEFRALEIIQNLHHQALMELRAYWLLDRHGQAIPDELRGQANSPVPATLVIATKLADMNLTQVLERYQQEEMKPGIPVQELLGYLRQVAGALDYLNQPKHRLGHRLVSIQHRDVKPDNIMLANEMIKLTDFGLAKVLETDDVVAEIRQDSVGFTFHYAAPEVLRGKVTKWSDQYSLAITYYQLRTGELPYGKDCSAYDQMMRQLEGQLDLSRLLPSERKVVARATSVIPEERFPSCKALMETLTKAVPAAGELASHEEEDGLEETAALPPVVQEGFQTRQQEPLKELAPLMPSFPAGQRFKTMPVILAQGEVYPAPIKTLSPLSASSREASHEAPAATKVIPPRPQPKVEEEHARKPDSQYFLPLVLVFGIGICMAALVHFMLRGPGSEVIAKSTSPQEAPIDDRPYEFVGPLFQERRPSESIVNVEANKPPVSIAVQPRVESTLPAPIISKPPDLLTPASVTTPVPAPIMVLGRNTGDPTFPGFLNTSLDRMIANTSLPVQFSRSLRELEQVPVSMNSSKLLAFRAECMLEGETKNLLQAGAYLQQAVELGESTAYLQYVQARYWHEQRDTARAVLSLEESLKRDISLAGFRRDRALAIFEEAAQRVSIITDPRTLSATVATPVPSWIALAERYLGKVQTSSSLTMLLATLNPAPKDPAVLQPVLTASVQDEWSKRPQGAILITSLRLKQIDAAVAARQSTQALGLYADTWEYIKKNRSAFDSTSPLVLHDRILAPAQRVAAGLKPNAVRNTQLATILAGYGSLIYESPNEAWPLPGHKPAFRAASEAFGEAAKLYSGSSRTRAEYLTGQGQCLHRLGGLTRGDIAIMAANATAATTADASYAGGWNLLGLAKYFQITQDTSETQARLMLTESINAFDLAIRLTEQINARDRLLAQYRSNRSLAKSMLGDWTPVSNDQRRFLYQEAIQDALQATDLDAIYEGGWGALGQARERLADLLNGIPARTVFPEAVAAYTRQLSLRTAQADSHASMGRCLLRWAFDENNDPVKLDQGREELMKAISLDSNLADAHYWLGRYYLAKNDLPQAGEAFQKAIKNSDWGKKYLNLTIQTIDALIAQAPEPQKKQLQQVKVDLQAKTK